MGYQRWLHEYRKRAGGPLSVSSQHGRLVAVRGLFRWLVKQRELRVDPAGALELPRMTAQRLPQPLTDAEIARVLAQPDLTKPTGFRDRALLETAYSTGLRRKELIRLRSHEIDLARGTVFDAVVADKLFEQRDIPQDSLAPGQIEPAGDDQLLNLYKGKVAATDIYAGTPLVSMRETLTVLPAKK